MLHEETAAYERSGAEGGKDDAENGNLIGADASAGQPSRHPPRPARIADGNGPAIRFILLRHGIYYW
ncbi:hypothetical protein [Massilia violaceinigra]|uniref:hypothetical protein n=1 Tax=Massilia violaceinigra TaxID=2045208 RepID=UPI001E48C6B0|nr:hypothetical protein [Massilia violaceinigra]